MRTRLAITLIVSSLIVVGCSSINANEGLIQRLAGRGPVPLSTENPYLAANLFLTREMERSTELKGFIEHRGMPNALEISDSLFSPTEMVLYYSNNKEQYELESLDDTWAIRGPNPITADAIDQLTHLGISSDTRTAKSLPPRAPSSDAPHKKSAFQSPANPSIEPRPASDAHTVMPAPKFPDSHTAQRTELSELARTLGKEDAEITPKDDLVHYVTLPGETLSSIARWYTFDNANASRLARMNQLANPDTLEAGDVVVIPSYLLKNKKRLNEQALRALNSR